MEEAAREMELRLQDTEQSGPIPPWGFYPEQWSGRFGSFWRGAMSGRFGGRMMF